MTPHGVGTDESSSARRVIIGVCGIDGAGKSTLITRLLAWPPLRDATVAKMPPGENYQRLVRMHPGLWDRPAELIGTPWARALGWAEVFDFLHYQQRTIRPLRDYPGILVHDRWTPCWAAFCGSVAGLGVAAADRLRAATPADLVIWLDVPPERALARIRAVREPLPDEDIAVLRAFHAGYHEAYAKPDGPLLRIGDEDPDTVERMAKESIERVLHSTGRPSGSPYAT